MPDETTQYKAVDLKLLLCGVVLIAGALIALQFSGFVQGPLTFHDKMIEKAAAVIGGLAALALILERALAVFVDLLHGEERTEKQQQLNARRLTVAVPPPAAPGVAAAAMAAAVKARAEARATLAPALAEVAKVDAKRERFRLLLGFAVSFLVAAGGVRTIDELVTKDLTGWVVTLDIMLTAGLLAGGSNGLAKLVELLQEAANRKLTNLRTT